MIAVVAIVCVAVFATIVILAYYLPGPSLPMAVPAELQDERATQEDWVQGTVEVHSICPFGIGGERRGYKNMRMEATVRVEGQDDRDVVVLQQLSNFVVPRIFMGAIYEARIDPNDASNMYVEAWLIMGSKALNEA